MDEKIQEFHLNGYCILNSFFSPLIYDFNSLREDSLNNFSEIKEIIQQKELFFGVGLKEGYNEIVQRSSRRYEVTYKMKDIMRNFSESSELLEVIYQILGRDVIIANESLLISEPGATVDSFFNFLSFLTTFYL